MEENIRISESGGYDFLEDPNPTAYAYNPGTSITVVARYGTRYASWANRVRPGGIWDYKRLRPDDHEVFQDFGNFNFGMTGAAEGLPLWVLHLGAGVVQEGTDRWHGRPGPEGQPLLSDHPRDTAMINLGYAFYQARRRARRAR